MTLTPEQGTALIAKQKAEIASLKARHEQDAMCITELSFQLSQAKGGTLTGTSAELHGLDRMAAGMRLPTTLKAGSAPPPKLAASAASSREANLVRMARGIRLPQAKG